METRKLKNGKLRFREKVYINNKPTTSSWFARKTDASQWKQREASKRDMNIALGIPQTQIITFLELSNKLLKSKSHLTKNTITAYTGIINSYLVPAFNSFPLKDICFNDIEDFKYFLRDEENLSKNRINTILRVLKMSFIYAVEMNYLYQNPALKLKFLKTEVREINYWSMYECSNFLNQTRNDHYYEFYLVALNTGMRLGELIGLTWDSINFKESRIKVQRTMTRDGLQETTKSKRERSIPMNQTVKDTLLELHNNRRCLKFVFTNPKNKPVSYEHFTYRVFNKMTRSLNMRRIRFHDLRTTFASNFCMQGGDIFTLSRVLGHSSVEITQNRYAFLNDHFLKEEMNKFEITSDFSTVSAPQNVEVLKIR
jgi:integrase